MTDHVIRLRAAWDWCRREGDAEIIRRVDLPTDWPPGLDAPFLLRRKFGRPPGLGSAGSARLEMVGVPGLVAGWINGRALDLAGFRAVAPSIPLVGPLPARSVLVLEVDFRGLPGPPRAWGSIALIFSGATGDDAARPGLP